LRSKSTAFIRNDTSIWLVRQVGGGGAGRVCVGVGVGEGDGGAERVGVGRGVGLGADGGTVGVGDIAFDAAAAGRAVCDLHPAATGSTRSVATNTTAPRMTRISPPKPLAQNVLRSMPEVGLVALDPYDAAARRRAVEDAALVCSGPSRCPASRSQRREQLGQGRALRRRRI